MGQHTWEYLKRKRVQCTSRKTARVLFAYGNTEPLPTLGTFTADIMSPDKLRCRADFVVIKSRGRTLLCRETAERLNLLRVGPIHANSVVDEKSDEDIRREYKDILQGVGLLKDYELKLNIDDSVKPIAQQVRRIPYGLREKVDAKLDEFCQWVS
ncbi:uncharacterized protein [Ptychodera flava]|uniref:uncharacterized protein n=1 Tax=Ptychodera flava TaxID=63121 RepID=UPI00396A109C